MAQGMAYRAGLVYVAGGLPGQAMPTIARWRETFYRWTGAYYLPVTDEEVKAAVTCWLARNPTTRTDPKGKIAPVTESFVRDVLLAVRAETEVADTTAPGTWLSGPPAGSVGPFLATPGGVLDLGQLNGPTAAPLPNSPDYFNLSALPVAPAVTGTHPTWDRFLSRTFGENAAAIDVLQEVFGYCLWPDCRFEKFFIFHGPGNTGKSTVVETLQAVLGEANVGAISLDRLGGRFDLSGLVGKMANIIFDASEIDRTAEGTLKALVSGEPVPVEQKHRAIQSLRLTAKHIIATNALPRFHDTSDGIWRRLVLLPFDNVCPVEERDPSLKGKLRGELAAIAGWALGGLARLLAQGQFTSFERGERLAAEYCRESNPVRLFLDGHCEPDPEGRVARKALYAAYRAWAAENGFVPLSVTRFNREVRALYPQPDHEVRDGRGGDRMFLGLRLKGGGGVLAAFGELAGCNNGSGQ
jgi:P4 family phage/plasmid primase-like protien